MEDKLIHPHIETEIEIISELYEYSNPRYIYDEENSFTSFIIRRFMKCDNKCWKELMIYTGIYKIILDAYRSAVGKPEITGLDKELVEQIDFKKLTEDKVIAGKTVIEVGQKDGEKVLEIIPPQEFFVINGIPTRIQFFVHHKSGIKHKYVLIKEYGIGTNTNTLYQIEKGIGHKTIPLDSIEETEHLEASEDTFMTTYNIVWREYDSLFESVRSMEAAIQRKMIAVDNDLIKFVQSKYLAKGIKNIIEKRNGVLINKFDEEDILIGDVDSSIEIIERTNEKTEEAWDVIRSQVRFISGLSKLGPEHFGMDITGSNIGVNAQAIRNAQFVNIIEDTREDYVSMILELGLSVQFVWKLILGENESELQGVEDQRNG